MFGWLKSLFGKQESRGYRESKARNSKQAQKLRKMFGARLVMSKYKSLQKSYPNMKQKELDDLATRRVLEQVTNDGVTYIQKRLNQFEAGIKTSLQNLDQANLFTELRRIEKYCKKEMSLLNKKATQADDAAQMLGMITNRDERRRIQVYGTRLKNLRELINAIAVLSKKTSLSDPIPLQQYKAKVNAKFSKFKRAA